MKALNVSILLQLIVVFTRAQKAALDLSNLANTPSIIFSEISDDGKLLCMS